MSIALATVSKNHQIAGPIPAAAAQKKEKVGPFGCDFFIAKGNDYTYH